MEIFLLETKRLVFFSSRLCCLGDGLRSESGEMHFSRFLIPGHERSSVFSFFFFSILEFFFHQCDKYTKEQFNGGRIDFVSELLVCKHLTSA